MTPFVKLQSVNSDFNWNAFDFEDLLIVHSLRHSHSGTHAAFFSHVFVELVRDNVVAIIAQTARQDEEYIELHWSSPELVIALGFEPRTY